MLIRKKGVMAQRLNGLMVRSGDLGVSRHLTLTSTFTFCAVYLLNLVAVFALTE